jgi:hypothetical protein
MGFGVSFFLRPPDVENIFVSGEAISTSFSALTPAEGVGFWLSRPCHWLRKFHVCEESPIAFLILGGLVTINC